LIRLQKKLETTLIYVTHDQVEAMTMSDRVAIMDKGKLLQVGSAINIYHHPDNIFVAGFIGSPAMNLIDCSFTSKNGAGILQASGFSIELPSDMISVIKEKASGSELVVGFRPEDITVSRNDIPESIKAEVYALEPVGKEIIVDLKIGDNMIRAVAPPTFSAKIGDTAYMLIHKSELHVYDRKTESAII
jgi:multiple sugar transport system ATP-binding protein